MPFQEIFTNNSTPDECNNDIMSEKPFIQALIDASSDDLSADFETGLEYENPFCDEPLIFQKKRLAQKCTSPQNWTRSFFMLQKSNYLIRSAPQSLESTELGHMNNGENISLPTLGCGKSDAIKRISAHTLVSLINKTFERDYLLIDARFGYEYKGGHIWGAINVNNEEDIFRNVEKHKILIFYCEFSSFRGPTLARRVRNRDRKKNEYPTLDFPEIYVLEKGYRNFFEEFPQLCTPSSYIQMHDKRFKNECAYYHKKIKIKKN